MILRGVAVIILGTIAGACASGSPSPDEVKRAWKAALVSPACPEQHMITADRRWLKFIVSGCGLMEQVEMACDEQQCAREVLSSTRLAQPQRLRPTDGKRWADPAHAGLSKELILPPATAAYNSNPKVVVAGARLTDINAPAHKPTLPKEINRAGIVVWGLYMVCVTNEGDVHAISVIKSDLPGGMDAHWISKIETWKYDALPRSTASRFPSATRRASRCDRSTDPASDPASERRERFRGTRHARPDGTTCGGKGDTQYFPRNSYQNKYDNLPRINGHSH